METSYIIRFNDCDPYGHLNNSRYIDYMLNAREDHVKQYYNFDLKSFYQNGLGWFITAHEILYLRPAGYNESIIIKSGLLEAGNSHLMVEMSMWDEAKKQLKSLLWTQFVCINIKTGSRENHPADFMEFIKDKVLQDVNHQEGMKARAAQLSGKASAP